MSNDFPNTTSPLTSFMGAARDLQREINGATARTHKAMVQEGIFGVSESDLEVLRLVLEFSGQYSAPLEIAEHGMMDKGAFIRCLPSLENDGHVTLTRTGTKITSVVLTDEGRRISALFQEKLRDELDQLYQSDGLSRLVTLVK